MQHGVLRGLNERMLHLPLSRDPYNFDNFGKEASNSWISRTTAHSLIKQESHVYIEPGTAHAFHIHLNAHTKELEFTLKYNIDGVIDSSQALTISAITNSAKINIRQEE